MEKKGQESAFPFDLCNDGHHSDEAGMSKRFYAACAAIPGILASPTLGKRFAEQFPDCSPQKTYEIVVRAAFDVSDELLKQEENSNGN